MEACVLARRCSRARIGRPVSLLRSRSALPTCGRPAPTHHRPRLAGLDLRHTHERDLRDA